MTSTNFNVGMENDIRPSSKVLKPPGGGSSDIFAVESASQPARRNRNQSQLQSSMFTNMMETTASKTKSGNNSHSRLFGSEPPFNIPMSNADSVENDVTDAPSNSQARDTRRNPINHDGMTAADCSQSYYSSSRNRNDRKPDGNPVTGEGYAIANGVKEIAATNGIAQPIAVSETASTTASSLKTNGVKSAPPSRPGRVPPGGFSSGLW